MRKEILFALITGIAFGLVITFGIWRTNYKKEESKQTVEETQEKKETSIEKTSPSGLTILKPEENELVTEETIKIEGITEPEAQVVISTEGSDYLTKADNKGGFSKEVKLVKGINEILITSFTKKEEVTITLPLVYSSEFEK